MVDNVLIIWLTICCTRLPINHNHFITFLHVLEPSARRQGFAYEALLLMMYYGKLSPSISSWLANIQIIVWVNLTNKHQGLTFKDSDLLNLQVISRIVDSQPETDDRYMHIIVLQL